MVIHFILHVNALKVTPAIFLFFLAGCASHDQIIDQPNNATPKIISSSFRHTVQQGVTNTIKIPANANAINRHEDMQYSLVPAGPYVSHSQPLGYQPLAIISAGRFAYVATSSSKKNYKE